MIAALLIASMMMTGHGHPSTVASPVVSAYTVRAGDSLWLIAGRRLGNPMRWPDLYAANVAVVGSNPDLIYPGERLTLVMHALRPAQHRGTGTHRIAGGAVVPGLTVAPPTARPGTPLSGTLGCAGLERLWVAAGGRPGAAFIAAEIAMAESGGSQYAHSPTDDYGYWQINASNGSLATYDPAGNARAAVILSGDGADWSPWTTYTSGAYAGRCLGGCRD